MEERTGTIADYFVVAGLPENPEPVDDDYCEGLNPNDQHTDPITDITVIFPTLGELVPRGFTCVEETPSGYPANLNSGSIRSPVVYLCYRRGTDKPPLVDIGVMYEGKERLLHDAEVVISTPEGRPANVNNTSAKTFLTYRRALENMPCNELVVTDICVIIQNKGERPPHAFCLIMKNLNKGMMGCDVYLCYKKSMHRPPLLSYKAAVLHRYPPVDRRGFPFPSSVAMFCMPMCATIECWPKIANQPRPVFSTFVLTVADATEKIYGAAVIFYEEFPEEKLNAEQKVALGVDKPGDNSKSVHVNKCICLLSHYPFFDSFRTFLSYLHNMSRKGSYEVPIERYISHLLEEVPFPSPSRPHILWQLSPNQTVLMAHQHDSPLPKCGASFRSMLSNLGPENCLLVLLLLLTEQKTLIHSLRPDVLTAVVEAVSVIIFPFHWQCPYIPLCPLGLCAVLQAPVPFLVGVDSRFFDLYELPCDVTCVDLDTNTITVSEDKRSLLNIKLLAKKPARILKHTLENLQEKIYYLSKTKATSRADAQDPLFELDFQLKRRERMLEIEIQEAFLRFMTSVLKGYRSFLLPITKAPTVGATDASSLFDFQGFLRSRDKNYQKFYQLMVRTQMFIRFIEERSFVSDIDTGLAFFDECIDKVCQDDSDMLRLIDLNEGNQSDRTVYVMPPEPVGLPPNATYCYNSVFKLNESLFGNVKLKSSSLDRVMQQNDMSAPGSPIARRTKQEIRSAQNNARKYSEVPMQWAKYLMSTCYSLWFIHLPSYLSVASSKHMALCLAYEMLVRMAKTRIQPADEVCYRVVMQLCGLYSQPVTAVKVLFEMKRCGITPNAITYGFYNKAVLEAQWPSNVSNSSQLMWNKLRNVIDGVARFRAAGRHYNARNRRLSQSTDEVDRISTGSGTSVDSQTHGKVLSQKILALNAGIPPSNSSSTPKNLQEDSNNTQGNIPTRISSSSDVGYGSMNEQKVTDTETEPEQEDDGPMSNNNADLVNSENTKVGRFWGKMGQSLDHWVKSGVSGLASVAALASDTSYYSPGGLIMAGYRGDYSTRDEEDNENESDTDTYDDEQRQPGPSRRRIDFNEEENEEYEKKSETFRLLRSISFGNDTQIMSKLQELKHEMVKANGVGGRILPTSASSSKIVSSTIERSPSKHAKRSGSEESNGSLETKVNEFYESNSRKASPDKSHSSPSREVTPVEEEPSEPACTTDRINTTLLPPVPKSPSIQIKPREWHESHESNVMNKEVSPCSPARTPVTQNDPLGALSHPPSPDRALAGPSALPNHTRGVSPKRACSEGFIGHILTPPRAVGGSHNGGKDLTGTGFASKAFHRSSTLPNYSLIMGEGNGMGSPTSGDDKNLVSCSGMSGGSSSNVVSSISAFSSSLKNPFGRYSPARLSLRKAGTSLIESTIGNKKAEALMEGFNQFKSQATVTAKKKLDEFKEAIATNAYPPGKNGPFGGEDYRGEPIEGTEWDGADPGDQWASVSESYLDQILTADGSTRASFASGTEMGPSHDDTPLSSSVQSLLMLDSSRITAGSKKDQPPVALIISMTTCSVCHNCDSLLFDEEIMAGWTAEDSNLNTKCPHCKKWEVPFLEVTVKDFRHYPVSVFIPPQPLTSAPSVESVNSANRSRRTSMAKNSANPLPSNLKLSNNALHTESSGDIVDSKEEKSNGVDVTDFIKPSRLSEDRALTMNSSRMNGETPSSDPLGVLEEKSRRNSPEPEDVPVPSIASQLLAVPGIEDKNTVKPPPTIPPQILEGIDSEPIIVPYLSPLVLRKELENVLEHEGDSCLTQCRFVDEHPILYWNLVWFYHRANLTSHLKGLTLLAKSIKPTKLAPKYSVETNELLESELEKFLVHPSWDSADHRNVVVSCKWDNPKFHEKFGEPLYIQHLNNQRERENLAANKTDDDNKNERRDSASSKLISDILRSVQRNQLAQTCPSLLYHYHKNGGERHFPAYRDILFLTLTAGSKESFESYGYGFDRDYRDVYSRLRNSEEYESMGLGDTPPSDAAIFCRRFFRDLEIP